MIITTFNIPGEPVGKKRPRFYRMKSGGVGTYHEQATDEGKFKLFLANQWAGKSQLSGPVSISCHFYFQRPKSHYGTGRNSDRLKPSAPHIHATKPDLDNCVKFVKDCCNGIVWRDDKQVWRVAATKTYAEGAPHTEIEIGADHD